MSAHAAINKLANESDAAAFSRIFSAQTPEGLEIRKACAVCKNTPAPMMVTEPTQQGGDDFDVNDAKKANDALTAIANEQRRRAPELSVEQAFARVFENPDNAVLANRAHRRPRAEDTGAYPYPTT